MSVPLRSPFFWQIVFTPWAPLRCPNSKFCHAYSHGGERLSARIMSQAWPQRGSVVKRRFILCTLQCVAVMTTHKSVVSVASSKSRMNHTSALGELGNELRNRSNAANKVFQPTIVVVPRKKTEKCRRRGLIWSLFFFMIACGANFEDWCSCNSGVDILQGFVKVWRNSRTWTPSRPTLIMQKQCCIDTTRCSGRGEKWKWLSTNCIQHPVCGSWVNRMNVCNCFSFQFPTRF